MNSGGGGIDGGGGNRLPTSYSPGFVFFFSFFCCLTTQKVLQAYCFQLQLFERGPSCLDYFLSRGVQTIQLKTEMDPLGGVSSWQVWEIWEWLGIESLITWDRLE